jgi:cohesin complex subunit SCC1
VLTELDLLPSLPDASFLTQPAGLSTDLDLTQSHVGRKADITLMDWSSQLLPESIEQGRGGDTLMLYNDDLDLDFGDEVVDDVMNDTSIEMGRDAPAARALGDDLFSDNIGADDDIKSAAAHDGLADASLGGNTRFGSYDDSVLGDDGMNLNFGNDGDLAFNKPDAHEAIRRDRSETPLSELEDDAARDLEEVFNSRNLETTDLEPLEFDESVHQPKQVRKRKVLQPDEDTMLPSKQIKQQQEDRSKILKPASFLPRDPMMLSLMAMQKNGGFVSSIFGEGRGKGWAPELKGILSLEVIRRAGQTKRKRDSGVADLEEQDAETSPKGKQPRLELGDEESEMQIAADIFGGNTTILGEQEEISALDRMPQADDDDDDGVPHSFEDDDNGELMTPVGNNFDDTIAPLVHPADDGPVSLGTKRAVHLLREHFGSAESESASQKKSVLFQDLLPERGTAKADATKMFFEVLVLATKDAIKVEQQDGILGGPIRVRGKRGLWGAWAEKDAGGEIAEKEVPLASGPAALEVAA